MEGKKLNLLQLLMMLLMIFFIGSTSSFADNRESIENIKHLVNNFVITNTQINDDESIEVKVSQAGSQFQIPTCSKDVVAEQPKSQSKEQITTVELTCNGTTKWHLYVPVDVQIYSKVVATKRAIPAKEIITEADLDFTLANKNRLYTGYFTKKEDVIGNVALHTMTAGIIITKKNVHLPILIHKNQTVTLTAVSRSVMVSMAGIAKSDGALNALIKVFNPSSKRTIDAIVIGPNKAQVVS
jgi:flagellar basal body P-ring formation protein FlgA